MSTVRDAQKFSDAVERFSRAHSQATGLQEYSNARGALFDMHASLLADHERMERELAEARGLLAARHNERERDEEAARGAGDGASTRGGDAP